MKVKKILAVLLTGLLSTSILASCGKQTGGESEKEGSQSEGKREAYTVKILASGDGSSESCKAVSAELSKITEEKFNTKIELTKGYTKESLNLILTSGEKLDLFPVFSWEMNLSNLVGNEQLVAMDTLLKEYAPDTLKAISKSDWKCATIGGKIFGVPANSDKATAAGVLMRKDVVDELKIDYKNITTMEKLEEVLTLVKEKKPDMYPLVSSFGGITDYTPFDGAGNNFGVLENLFEDNTTFVNYYESDSYKKMAELRWDWNKKGLIMPDATSNTEDARSIIGAGKGFCSFFRQKPGVENQESAAMGTEVVAAEIFETRSITDMVGGKVWSIPANSDKPERAMEVLDLLYNDANASNVFINGMEDTHYVYTDASKKTIDYPKGKDGTTIGFTIVGWGAPNQQITPVRVGDEENLWEQLNKFNSEARSSPAKGFTFDAAKVLNEVTACTNVTEKYLKAIECGAIDPKESIPQFNTDLKAAGVDTIMAEKQTQFDAWLATQK